MSKDLFICAKASICKDRMCRHHNEHEEEKDCNESTCLRQYGFKEFVRCILIPKDWDI